MTYDERRSIVNTITVVEGDSTMKPISVPELELKILTVLWEAERASSVQEVLDDWDGISPGYTTVLKKLQVMEEKGLVCHEKAGKSYLYAPTVSRDEVIGGNSPVSWISCSEATGCGWFMLFSRSPIYYLRKSKR